MKIEISDNMSQTAHQIVNKLSDVLINLCKVQEYERISIQKICQTAKMPRSTFYNYFDSKEDLLNYCWIRLEKELILSDHFKINSQDVASVFLERIYNVLSSSTHTKEILRHNSKKGELITSFHFSMQESIYLILLECDLPDTQSLPLNILVNHISNTILLVLEQCLLSQNNLPINKGKEYLKVLIGGLF